MSENDACREKPGVQGEKVWRPEVKDGTRQAAENRERVHQEARAKRRVSESRGECQGPRRKSVGRV